MKYKVKEVNVKRLKSYIELKEMKESETKKPKQCVSNMLQTN